MEISFVNMEPYPCGCKVRFSDGGNYYSDVITVTLCDTHSPDKHPKDGMILTAAGTWVKNICNKD